MANNRAAKFKNLVAQTCSSLDSRIDYKRPTKSYIIVLSQLKNLGKVDLKGNDVRQCQNYSIRYHCTLYDSAKSTFFGRTCQPNPNYSELKESAAGFTQLDSTEEEFIYFHSSNIESVLLTVEVEVKKKFDTESKTVSGGFATFNVPEQVGKVPKAVEVQKGTPRQIITNKADSKGKAELVVEIFEAPEFNCLEGLVNQNILVSIHETIPGLAGEKIIKPVREGNKFRQEKLKTVPFQTIYLHNLQLAVSKKFEEVFEEFLMETCKQESGLAADDKKIRSPIVQIEHRRVYVSVCNGWKEKIGSEVEIKIDKINNLDHVFKSNQITYKFDNYIPHESCAIVFRIQYDASVSYLDQQQTKISTIGWHEYMCDYNGRGVTDQHADFIVYMGPGKTISKEVLWCRNKEVDNFQIRITGDFSSENKMIQTMEIAPVSEVPLFRVPEDLTLAARNFEMTEIPTYGKSYNNKSKVNAQGNYGNFVNPIQSTYGQQPYENRGQLIQSPYGQPQYDPKVLDLLNNQGQEMRSKFEMIQTNNSTVNDKVGELLNIIRQQQLQLEKKQSFDAKVGVKDYDVQSRMQIEMIGNVFYNMLTMIGDKDKDPRFTELGANVKSMLQTGQFDSLAGPKVPHMKNGVMNLLKVVDVPKEELGDLAKHGLGDLLRGQAALKEEAINMETEQRDILTASTITFKFLVFKTPPVVSKQRYSNEDNSAKTAREMQEKAALKAQLPRKIFFQFRFFSFPEIQTDSISLTSSLGDGEVYPGQTYNLVKENYVETPQGKIKVEQIITNTHSDIVSVVFEIDSSITEINDQHVQLAKYMKNSYLNVDIFDAESRFIYATCKLPIYELLRQGKAFVSRAKEAELCAPDTQEFRGSIQLVMSNQGHMPKVEVAKDEHAGRGGQKQPSQKIVRSKPMNFGVVSQTDNPMNQDMFSENNKPMDFVKGGTLVEHLHNKTLIDTMHNEQVRAAVQNQDLRKKLRVDRVKNMTFSHGVTGHNMDDPKNAEWQKQRYLREIQAIREVRKIDIVQTLLNNGSNQNNAQISVIPGRAKYHNVLIHNTTDYQQTYTYSINDPDSTVLGNQQEIQLLTSQNEFLALLEQGVVQRFQTMPDSLKEGRITLGKQEEFTLVFKFLTYREVSLNKDAVASKSTIHSRRIAIRIQQGGGEYKAISLLVKPSFTPIDYVFRYFEPEHSDFQVVIPRFQNQNQPNLKFVMSNPETKEHWEKNSSSLTVLGSCGEAMTTQVTTMFLYADDYKRQSICAARIEIMSRPVIYTKVRIGSTQQHTLSLPADKARTIRIFSTKPDEIFITDISKLDPNLPKDEVVQTMNHVEKTRNSKINLNAQTINHIQIWFKFNKEESALSPTIINAVDLKTSELVYSWLLVVNVIKADEVSKNNGWTANKQVRWN